jgi:ketosteroid isomerase-like protein
VRDLGDRVLVISTQRGRGQTTGIELAERYATLYEVRGGEIVSFTLFPSEEAALSEIAKGREGTDPATRDTA